MKIAKLGAALLAGALVTAAFAPAAHAASPYTAAFLANLEPNVDFLDRSSRFALTNSKNARLKDFAKSEAREQTLVANAVDAWIESGKTPEIVASAAAPDADGVVTGRSVAVAGAPQGQVADDRLPMGQEDLDRLEGMNGKDFDDLYKSKQLEALYQVQTDYEHYIAKGDDPQLLAMANRELPKIKKRLAALAKL